MARFVLDINSVNGEMSEIEAKNVSEMICEYLIEKDIGKGIITINPIDLTNENQFMEDEKDNFITNIQIDNYNKIIGHPSSALSNIDLIQKINHLEHQLKLKDIQIKHMKQLRDAENISLLEIKEETKIKKLSFNEIPIGSCFAYYEDLGSRNIPVGKKENEDQFFSYLKNNTFFFDEKLKDEKLFVCVVHSYYGPSIHEVPDEPPHYVLKQKPFNVLGMDI